MPEPWYPGAIRVDGANANYANGRNRMEVVKRHFTVGINSWGYGYRGYFQWLANRDGTGYQFAPVDALCFDSGEWNDAGPGVEIEYYAPVDGDVIFTDAARGWTAGLCSWLHTEHGFPLDAYEGAVRIGEWAGFRGFIDHRDLVQTDQHTDFWSDADWYAMIAPPQPPTEDDDMQTLFYVTPGFNYYRDPLIGMVFCLNASQPFQALQITQDRFDEMNVPLDIGAGGGGGGAVSVQGKITGTLVIT